MGQRITAKSTVDISYEKMTSVPNPCNIPSSGPASFDSVSLLSHKILTGTGSPATPSRIPMRRGSMNTVVRKTNSISSSTVSRNSSDRSLTASPIKSSQSVMSVNNNNGRYIFTAICLQFFVYLLICLHICLLISAPATAAVKQIQIRIWSTETEMEEIIGGKFK